METSRILVPEAIEELPRETGGLFHVPRLEGRFIQLEETPDEVRIVGCRCIDPGLSGPVSVEEVIVVIPQVCQQKIGCPARRIAV